MKYLILLLDGAADEPIKELGNQTVLEFAHLESINKLANLGEVGSICTVPVELEVASDVANLNILGYDPRIYLTGRAPFEALSMGIEMGEADIAYRASTVTLQDPKTQKVADENTVTPYEDLIIQDYSASLITTEETGALIGEICKEIGTETGVEFYPGVSYRQCMILRSQEAQNRRDVGMGELTEKLNTPQDNIGGKVGDLLPKEPQLAALQKKSYEIMRRSKINADRIKRGLNPANSIWLWGEGRKPDLPDFQEKYGISAAVVSAVDLIKGIACAAGMRICNVSGATGTLDTNYEAKKAAAIEQFESGTDLVYIHMEGPDECGHQGDLKGKIQSLERIDSLILKPILEYFRNSGTDFRILVLPDHKTPVKFRVHMRGEVPFLIYDSTNKKKYDPNRKFTEKFAVNGKKIKNGYEIMDYILKNNF